jgi:methylmalonyl-CoA mutase cobalamin-binding subunit
MPTPTPDEIIDAAAQNAADGVASGQVDGRQVTAIDPLKQLDVADKVATKAAVAGTNPQGGSKSGWRTLRAARAIPPGAT